MMISLYHGTTEESYHSIIEKGFDHDTVVWTCSDPKMIYFYDQRMVAKDYNLTLQGAKRQCCELALQSAFATAALTNSKSQNLYVFEVQIPESYLDLISPDESTGDWDGLSVCVSTNTLGHFFCNVYASPDSYSPRLAALYLCSLSHQEHLPDMILTELERNVIDQIDDTTVEIFLSTVNRFLTWPKLLSLHRNIHVSQPQVLDSHKAKPLIVHNNSLKQNRERER